MSQQEQEQEQEQELNPMYDHAASGWKKWMIGPYNCNQNYNMASGSLVCLVYNKGHLAQ